MNNLWEQMKCLGQLQEIDKNLDRLTKEQENIPKLIETIQEKISTAQAHLDSRTGALKALQKKRLAKEKKMEESEKRITDDKVKMMSLKTNVEYAALTKEIEQAGKSVDACAEDILILMEKIEHSEVEIKKSEALYEDAKTSIDQETATHRERLEEIPKELDTSAERKGNLVEGLPPDLLKRYENLRKQRQGLAIVKANDQVCYGCNMSIAPQVINRLQRHEELIFCASCQRILYWDGEGRINR